MEELQKMYTKKKHTQGQVSQHWVDIFISGMEEKLSFRKCLINFLTTEHIIYVEIQHLRNYGYHHSSPDKYLKH